MTLEGNAKLEEKLACGLENDMRNLAYFHQEHTTISKLGLSFGPFLHSRKIYELKTYRGVMCYDIEE